MNSVASVPPLPDLVLVLRRDGTTLSWTGGDSLPELRNRLQAGIVWSEGTRDALRRLARQCIASRQPIDAHLDEENIACDVRVTPQGPDRVVCTWRKALPKVTDHTADETGMRRRPGLERRSFTRQLRDRLARAALQERPFAVAVVQIDGLPGIAQSLGARVADRVMAALLQAVSARDAEDDSPHELLGLLGESVLAVALDGADRQRVESRLMTICDVLREPREVDGVTYRLAAWTGVAITGVDRGTPTQLLDQASAAATEARLANQRAPRFHTDTVRVRALDRIDLVEELRKAVARREIFLRFTPRHDLLSGALTTRVAYLHWPHPFRGVIPPTEFLNIAEGTGIGAELSKASLHWLCSDFQQHVKDAPAHARISFGPLRDHVLESDFAPGVLAQLDDHGVPPDRVELRIAERTFVTRGVGDLKLLEQRGIRLVVDEVGRSGSSLANLARAPLWGLQLDRSWAAAPASDFGARGVCRAVAAIAGALGLEALATGVDDERRRHVLLELGYRYGAGDLFAAAPGSAVKSPR